MEFTQSGAKLTVSEATWISKYRALDKPLRRKAEKSRRAALQPFTTKDITAADLPLLPGDALTDAERDGQLSLELLLTGLALNHSTDETGDELHLAEMELSNTELLAIAFKAMKDRDSSRETAMNFSGYLTNEVDEAFEPSPDPDSNTEMLNAQEFEVFLQKQQVTSGIVTAIAKHLGNK
ncbi:MAG TPA: hypothetical protein VLG16_00910 [Candidatus Saccharimonadales bacterium]|nr:hypothetical protein [Candidatus Saccharimonadales bacterium]